MPALVASVLLAIASCRGLLGGGGARLGIALLIVAGVLGRLAVRVSARPPVGVSASVARG